MMRITNETTPAGEEVLEVLCVNATVDLLTDSFTLHANQEEKLQFKAVHALKILMMSNNRPETERKAELHKIPQNPKHSRAVKWLNNRNVITDSHRTTIS